MSSIFETLSNDFFPVSAFQFGKTKISAFWEAVKAIQTSGSILLTEANFWRGR